MGFMSDAFFDYHGWQAWLERAGMPPASAAIGLLQREDHSARCGTLLLLSSRAEGCRVALREYNEAPGDDVAVLLVADADSFAMLRGAGLEKLPGLIRQGRLHAFMLKTLDELEAAGLAEFVEDLGLVFPRH
ncbi:MAG: hypothetical protein MOGDAGHF_01493 [Rhodocyclaceae bacterium]|jgi:hypothetical protein|nr:hypothetical protein [Rhodocyclaceae bacterium]